MALRVGDLVAEDYTLYWRFYNRSYHYMTNVADPDEGEAQQTIGIITSVHKRYPDAFFEIPYYVYKIKWLNSQHGIYWDDKYFYEDELILLSRVHQDEPDPEHEDEWDFDEEGEEEEE